MGTMHKKDIAWPDHHILCFIPGVGFSMSEPKERISPASVDLHGQKRKISEPVRNKTNMLTAEKVHRDFATFQN